jgi:hypothetical protein
MTEQSRSGVAVGMAVTGHPPAQIRASAPNAHGSYLGCLDAKRTSGYRHACGSSSSSPSPTDPHLTGCRWPQGLSILACEVSMHAWGLRLRSACVALAIYRAPQCCLLVRPTPSAHDFGYFGAHHVGIPSLPVPVSNASSARVWRKPQPSFLVFLLFGSECRSPVVLGVAIVRLVFAVSDKDNSSTRAHESQRGTYPGGSASTHKNVIR